MRIIGLGQRAAGDDAVGLSVIEHLRTLDVPEGVQLCASGGGADLVPLLDDDAICVDAILGDPPGTVDLLEAEDLEAEAPLRMSSHGMSVPDAISLARTLGAAGRVWVVAVRIRRPERHHHGLSPEVTRAVPRAAQRALDLAIQLGAPPPR